HFAYINQAGMDMLGLSDEEVHILAIQSLVSPDSQRLLTDDFMLNLLGQPQADIELSFVTRHRPDPIWVSLNVFTIIDPDTGDTNIAMVGQNQTEKRGMIDALAQSQAHWRNLAEAMPEFVWTCAADGSCEYLNQKWADYTGIPSEAQLGSGWLKQIHPDDQTMLAKLWAQSVSDKTALDVEFRIRRHDGHYRWFKTRGVPIYDAEGNISKWYGSNTDIQALKEIQEALSVERNALAIWFDTTPLALWEVNSTQAIAYLVLKMQSGVTDLSRFFRDHPDARATLLSGVKVVDCNPETIRMRHAQSKKGLLGTLLDLCTTPESQQDYTEMILDSFQGKNIRNRQMRAVTKDGQVLHLFLSLTVINKDPKRRRAIVAESDVSEKLQLEAELERYQQHLEALVVERTREVEQVNYFLHTVTDALPVLIGYWDQDQKCKFANKTYLPLFGRDHVTLIGQDMKTVIGSELYAQNIHYIEGALKGVQQRFERAITKADGSIFHSITNYIPDIQHGEVKGFFVLSSDVTEVKEAQLEMERLNQALKERTLQAENASKAKGEFVANMSHEIRTPMNAVIGMTQLLAETVLTEQQLSYLSKIHAASAGLMNILNDILDYSKMEAGRLEVALAELDVDDLLEKVSDLFSISASAKQIELIFEVSATTPKYITSDGLRLTQILNNLIGNAIKFTTHGSVRICVDYQAAPVSEIRFDIIDTGIGMSAEQINYIFTPFMQADSSTTRRFGGTGLGLSICHHLVTLMGGEIGVESEPHTGSRFWFRLPVEVRDKQHHSVIYQALHKRVLIVDDSRESRLALLTYLQQWQITTAIAEDAESGLQLILQAQADERPFDLLLLDWKMPQRSGLWLANEVYQAHQRAQLAHLPVIAMVTAYEVHELVEETRQHDVTVQAILTKPVIPSQLYNLLSDSQIASPLAPAMMPHGQLPQLGDTMAFAGLRALLVEDNQVNQEVALALLEKVGIQVVVANNGSEAVQLFEQQHYDIILMDLHMPVMDGFEATSRIRATEKGRAVPIIALTAAAFGEDKHKAIAAGMSDHLAKPINLAMLAALLSQWLVAVSPGSEPAAMAQMTYSVIAGIDIDATLQRLGLAWPQVQRFIRNFATQFEAWPQQISAALAQQLQDDAIRLAHTLKGAAMNIGADALAAQAARLEKALKAGDASDLPAVEQALTHLLTEIRQQLMAEVAPTDAADVSSADLPALLAELTPLLTQHRMLPKLLRKRADVFISHPVFGQQVTALLSSVDRFDFNGALAIIDEIRKELGNESESSQGEVHHPDRR
ncbi:MAG TPA: response regulator, partial [Methylophilus sp.]